MWKIVVGFSHYEINEYGEVRRLFYKNNRVIRHVILLQFKANGLSRITGRDAALAPGYWAVVLRNSSGKRIAKYIHRLVCETFNGPQPSPDRRWVAHKDDTRDNNHFDNLYWATPKENHEDAIRNGRIKKATHNRSGENHPTSKLSKIEVDEIRSDSRTQKQIAFAYGISAITVWRIRNNKSWVRD